MRKKYVLICVLLLLAFIVFLYIQYYKLAKFEKRFWFNYLDQSGKYKDIAKLESNTTEPNNIFEYVSDGKIEYIYVYDDWYDVFNYVSDLDKKYFEYRVLTSDAYKLGPLNICVGTKKSKVDFCFSLTRQNPRPESFLCFDENETVNCVECDLYMGSIPNTYGQIGFIFENNILKYLIYYPEG